MSADKWETLLKQWENITLTPDTLIAPAFDDNPDQTDVPLPIIRVAGVEGWGFIDVPKELQGLAHFPELLREFVWMRNQLEERKRIYSKVEEKLKQRGVHEDGACANLIGHVISRILEGHSGDENSTWLHRADNTED